MTDGCTVPFLARVVALGNAGFAVVCGGRRFLFDPFLLELPEVPENDPARLGPDDVILITHSHWDHLNVEAVGQAAARGATVVLPQPAAVKMRRRGVEPALRVVEPTRLGDSLRLELPGAVVTAFRTRHGEGHNSYLLETAGLRLFHDGDNEDTRLLDRAGLAYLDALMMSTWLGAGWVEFIAAVAPRHWLIMHLDEEEYERCDRGTYFRDLCDHIPAGLRVLRPGEALDLAAAS
ncbi:MAG: metal-dependent hydrolase [Lentisphaerae bacterium ADurb.BinA184]|nr:MAG: metal-dependent hydrolase [Lentisphaerae bacterium ADurb.BinA184]